MTVCRVPNRRWIGAGSRWQILVVALLAAAAPARGQGPGLFYEAEGDGVPVVLVADWAHDTGSWFQILPALRSEGWRPVRYDLRGQGRSGIPADGDYSLAAHRADLLRLLDGLGIARAHLVGTGLGGAVVLGFTLEHPARVLSVAAIDPRLGWSEAERESWTQLLGAWARIGRPTLGEYASVLVARWVGTGFVARNGWVVPWYDLMLRRQTASALIGSLQAALAEQQDLSAKGPVDTPTLIVVGEDWGGVAELDQIARAFPRLWRERLENSGAEPAVDAPGALAARLIEFLDSSGS